MRGDLEGSTTAWYKVLFAVWFLHSEAPHSAPNTQLQNQSLQEFSAGSNHLSLHYLLHSPVRTIVPARCLKWCYGQKQGQVLLDPFSQRTCSLYNFYSNVKSIFQSPVRESRSAHPISKLGIPATVPQCYLIWDPRSVYPQWNRDEQLQQLVHARIVSWF